MLNSWQRVNPRRRSASQAGLVVANAGRYVARRIADVGQPSMRSVLGTAAAAAAGAASLGAMRGSSVRSKSGVFLQGSMGGRPPKVRVSRKRKYKKSRAVFSGRVKKSLKKIINSPFKKFKLGEWIQNRMSQFVAAVNKVNWSTLDGATNALWVPFLQHEIMHTGADGSTQIYTQEPGDDAVVTTALSQKSYLIERRGKYVFRNNSTGPCELVIYKFQCSEVTNNDPPADLDARVTASYLTLSTTSTSTAAAPLAKEDNFQLYWSTHNMKHAQWKIVKSTRMLLASGDEFSYFDKIRVPINLRNAETGNYQKGQQMLICRVMGRPSHDSSVTTNLGVSDALLDCMECIVTTAYSTKESTAVSNFRTNSNSGFSTITPVIAGDASAAVVDKT